MRRVELTQGGGAASAAVDPVAHRLRLSAALAGDAANAAQAWLLSFVFVLALGADSGGYWPTAWNWTALTLLFVCALVLILRGDVRLRPVEVAVPLALLGLMLWGIASAAWSSSATQPLLDSQLTLVYAAGAFTALLFVRWASYQYLVGGALAAIVVVSSYSLTTRLFPERYGYVDSLAGYRLETPLGYWNALGIFATIGTLLAIGFAARGRLLAVRAAAGASTLILVPAMYFTFSRGAWIALGAGLVVMILLDPRRVQLVTTLLAVAPWSAIAVWHASGTDLAHIGGGLAANERAGHRLLIWLIVLAVAAAAAAAALGFLEGRVHVRRAVHLGYAGLLLLALVAGLAAVTARYGSPVTIAKKGYHNLVGYDNGTSSTDLNQRLFSLGLGQRIPQFRVAWHEYTAHPVLGTGLGTYERYWDQNRQEAFKVRNVHNLYLETLAELGPFGLLLLVVALGAPLVGALKARRRSLVPAAAAAYVAFLVHASVDWDWQMPAVTLAALFCGAGILAAGRPKPTDARAVPVLWRAVALGLVFVLGCFAFVGLRSNKAIAASQGEASIAHYAQAAADARTARFWAPWSATPLQLLGQAQAGAGDLVAARATFHRALAKDPASWELWLDLAAWSSGKESAHAFAEATKLNPLSPEIASRKPAPKGTG
jgi:hypothetical protein